MLCFVVQDRMIPSATAHYDRGVSVRTVEGIANSSLVADSASVKWIKFLIIKYNLSDPSAVEREFKTLQLLCIYIFF